MPNDIAAICAAPRGRLAQGVTWVRPELVCEVEFSEWTRDGLVRHPSFQGLREDKPALEVTREIPKAMKRVIANDRTATNCAKSNHRAANLVGGVSITHPDRILYPDSGLTKLELAKFHESLAERILPHLANRPLTVLRCPKGAASGCFYQKHLNNSLPDAVRGVWVQEEKNVRRQYIVIDDAPGLISLVQMGVLEFHPWLTTADRLDQPDRLVFDLDPGRRVPWKAVVDAARRIRRRIEHYELRSFVQITGGNGLHVIVPIEPDCTWAELKSFAKSIADQMTLEHPDTFIATASKSKRNRKIFIDYLRNARGATSVAPYSTRAREGALWPLPCGGMNWAASNLRTTTRSATSHVGSAR